MRLPQYAFLLSFVVIFLTMEVTFAQDGDPPAPIGSDDTGSDTAGADSPPASDADSSPSATNNSPDTTAADKDKDKDTDAASTDTIPNSDTTSIDSKKKTDGASDGDKKPADAVDGDESTTTLSTPGAYNTDSPTTELGDKTKKAGEHGGKVGADKSKTNDKKHGGVTSTDINAKVGGLKKPKSPAISIGNPLGTDGLGSKHTKEGLDGKSKHGIDGLSGLGKDMDAAGKAGKKRRAGDNNSIGGNEGLDAAGKTGKKHKAADNNSVGEMDEMNKENGNPTRLKKKQRGQVNVDENSGPPGQTGKKGRKENKRLLAKKKDGRMGKMQVESHELTGQLKGQHDSMGMRHPDSECTRISLSSQWNI